MVDNCGKKVWRDVSKMDSEGSKRLVQVVPLRAKTTIK